ncbi:MAG: hypothetical protein K8I02_03975, partial [Candidatus Methylomirabilis sp.]|nr:hypothetical protein [Deltaproteobacteria bacterium]
MSRTIEFLDSTLREGEQTPGVAFDRAAKLRLFEAIHAAGVRFFDVGMPASHWEEPKTVRELLGLGLEARIGVSVRATPTEIELAASLGVRDAFLIVPTSDLHLRKKLRVRPETWAEEVKRLLGLARRRGLAVHYVAEDASRADPAYLQTLLRDARKMAVESVFLCDTVGVLAPERSRAMTEMAVRTLGPKIDVGIHAHDDMGLAAANTLSALDAGARYASVTVNGLGERCGNASLHEVAVAARRLYGLRHSVSFEALPALAR